MHRASAAARQLPGGAGRHRGSRCESQKPAIARTRWKDHQQGTHTSAAFRPRWMDNKEGAQRRQQRQRPRRPGVSISASAASASVCQRQQRQRTHIGVGLSAEIVSRDCQRGLSARPSAESTADTASRDCQQSLSAEFVSGDCHQRLSAETVSRDCQRILPAKIVSVAAEPWAPRRRLASELTVNGRLRGEWRASPPRAGL